MAAGFAAAILLMGIAIYFGYRSAYAADAGRYTVRLLGLAIYELTKSGGGYAGRSLGPNMGVLCGVSMALWAAAEELLAGGKKR